LKSGQIGIVARETGVERGYRQVVNNSTCKIAILLVLVSLV
jgi:hypothetical protein